MSPVDAGGESAHQWVINHREDVLELYRSGVSMSRLAQRLGVSATWLTGRFDAWGEPRRGRAAAAALRGPSGPYPIC